MRKAPSELSQTPLAIYMRERKKLLQEKDLCRDCGKNAPDPGHTLCWECRDGRRVRERARHTLRTGKSFRRPYNVAKARPERRVDAAQDMP